MFEALVREINRLIHQTRRLARQNQQLLSRTIEIHRETLRALRPDIFSTTYDQRGGIHGGNGPGGFAAAV
jgi:flagellar biosynthesis/type III secretory pathway chaperone